MCGIGGVPYPDPGTSLPPTRPHWRTAPSGTWAHWFTDPHGNLGNPYGSGDGDLRHINGGDAVRTGSCGVGGAPTP